MSLVGDGHAAPPEDAVHPHVDAAGAVDERDIEDLTRVMGRIGAKIP